MGGLKIDKWMVFAKFTNVRALQSFRLYGISLN